MKMIQKSVYLLTIALFFASTIACENGKDTGDDENPQNYFTLSGETYELAKAFIEPWGENDNGSYDFDIYLVSKEIQHSTSSGEFFGIGDVVYIDLNTSSANGLVNGTYNYSSERNAFTFTYGMAGADLNAAEEEGDITEIVGGTVQIKVEGNITTIDFQLTTESNTTVEGNFTGNLTFI